MQANMILKEEEKQINEVHSSGMNRSERRKHLNRKVVCGLCGKKILFKNAYTQDKGKHIFCRECASIKKDD